MCDVLDTSIVNLFDQLTSQFLQQYYSHVLGLQVLVNTFAIHPAIEVSHARFVLIFTLHSNENYHT